MCPSLQVGVYLPKTTLPWDHKRLIIRENAARLRICCLCEGHDGRLGGQICVWSSGLGFDPASGPGISVYSVAFEIGADFWLLSEIFLAVNNGAPLRLQYSCLYRQRWNLARLTTWTAHPLVYFRRRFFARLQPLMIPRHIACCEAHNTSFSRNEKAKVKVALLVLRSYYQQKKTIQ